MADRLEVSVRTIYRDIATLQAMQTPIYGEAGVGYVMRRGYDLPPLNLDVEEAEAIAIGLSLIARIGDPDLWRAAGRASRKLVGVAPGTRNLVASASGIDATDAVNLRKLRGAIREERKIALSYRDAQERDTDRVIWPIVLIYYVDAVMVAGWCELRQAFRHFRLDRVQRWNVLEDRFTGRGAALLDDWEATQKEVQVTTRSF